MNVRTHKKEINMNKRFRQTRRLFVVSIVVLAMASVSTLAFVLFVTNTVSFDKAISSAQVNSLVAGNPEVAQYIQDQDAYQAHFVTLANLVKNDDQQVLVRTLILTGISIFLAAGIAAYILARRLLKPIQESFESQERFLQDAAHELRNPLAALYAVAQEARARPKASLTPELIETIERQVKQVVKINEDLLRFEKIKTIAADSRPINVTDLTHDVIEDLMYKAKQSKVRLTTTIAPDIHIAISDADWVCICTNVIGNAIKYNTPGGRVVVVLKKTKRRAQLVVSDDGIGIPSSELKDVSKRFYRGSNSGRTLGTGLGLAIVDQITTAYKGSLSIRSEQGKGTVVTVEFPVRS